MKKFFTIIVLLAAEVSLLTLLAQDDMYFMPSKSDIQKQKEQKKTGITGYYSGISKTDDQYNRRTGKDSLADDVIVFNVGKPSTNNNMEDVVYNFGDSTVQSRDVDYKLSRRLSRFDDYYYGWYDPWFCSRYYWGRPWFYGPYWYGPWYDPWYDPWFYGYYDPYYFNYWAFWGWPYDPFWYGPRWYGPGYYRPWEPLIVHNVHYGNHGAGTRNGPTTRYLTNASRNGGSVSGKGYRGQSAMNAVVHRNGDATTAMTNRSNPINERVANMYGDRVSNNFSHDFSSRANSSFGGGSSFSHGGGGFSGGGSGGGGSMGHGSFGGGRR